MKNLLVFAIISVLLAAANIGCDVDANLDGRKLVIDRITVEPDDWKIARTANNDAFDYFYHDVRIPEINEDTFNTKMFDTYWRTQEHRDGHLVDVQTPLPVVRHLERSAERALIPYTEMINCKYDIGYVRIMISRSDFYDARPTETLHFRTVISY